MTPPPSTREFVTITLIATDHAGLVVRSVEMIGPVCRARFSFSGEVKTSEAFCSSAASAFEAVSKRIIDQRGLLALPDFEVELEGLHLTDCRVVATEARDGGVQILIRFREYVGDLFAMFSEKHKMRESISGTSDQKSLNNLFEKAYIPLSDIAEHILQIKKDPDHPIDERSSLALIEIAKKIREIEKLR